MGWSEGRDSRGVLLPGKVPALVSRDPEDYKGGGQGEKQRLCPQCGAGVSQHLTARSV